MAGTGATLLTTKVRVVCRLRPLDRHELEANEEPAVTASAENSEVAVVRTPPNGLRQVRCAFKFDDVLAAPSTQTDVFSKTVQPLVGEVLRGREVACFAYGQTGTGKTYTMEGDLDAEEACRGIVPQAAAALLQRLPPDQVLTLSCLEIYNEELCDLLATPSPGVSHRNASPPRGERLDLKDTGRGVVCVGLSEVLIPSVGTVLTLIRRVQDRRRQAETRLNARSSRSHCLFTLKVSAARSGSKARLGGCGADEERAGRLHLVDLAGSECAKKADPGVFGLEENTGGLTNESSRGPAGGTPYRGGTAFRSGCSPEHAGGSERELERRSINQSLLTLGRVITTLREAGGRVPYRDSKLTRLLQEALGGQCQTVMVCTISPSLGAVDETISTLTYAEQAAGIQNRPVEPRSLFQAAARSGDEILTATPNRNNVQSRSQNRPRTAAAAPGASSSAESTLEQPALELRFAHASQDLQEAPSALERRQREAAQETTKQQALHDQFALELQESQGALGRKVREIAALKDRLAQEVEESQKVLTRKEADATALSDRLQTSERSRQALREELDESRQHGATTAGCLRQHAATSDGSRAQARGALAGVEGRVSELTAAATNAMTSLRESIEETHRANREVIEEAAATATEQRHLVDGLASSTRARAGELTEAAGAAVSVGRKAVVDFFDSEEERLAETEAAVRGLSAVAAEHLTKCEEQVASALEGSLHHQVASLCQDLRNHSVTLPTLARVAAQDLHKARLSLSEASAGATASREACAENGSNLVAGLAGLRDALVATSAESEVHAASSVAVRKRLTENSAAALTRRIQIGEALRIAVSAYATASRDGGQQVSKAIDELALTLAERGEAADAALATTAEKLGAAQADYVDAGERGEKAVIGPMQAAEELLVSAWGSSRSALNELCQVLAEVTRPQVSEGSSGVAAVTAAVQEIENALTAIPPAIAALDATRGNVAKEIAELVHQRAAQQEAVAILAQERRALQADVVRLREEASRAGSELGIARTALAGVEDEHKRACEAALRSVTDVVRREFEGLGRKLSEGTASVEGRLGGAAALLASAGAAGATVAAEEVRAARGLEAEQTLASHFEGAEAACGRAVADTEGRSVEALRGIGNSVAATSARISEVHTSVAAWGVSCERTASAMNSAANSVVAIRTSQDALYPRWAEQRAAVNSAATAWVQDSRAAGSKFGAALTHNAAAFEQVALLRDEVEARRVLAAAGVAAQRQAEDRHSAALAEIVGLQAQHAADDQVAEAERERALDSFEAHTTELVRAAPARASEASALMEAANIGSAHSATASADVTILDPALASAGVAASELVVRIEAALGGVSEKAALLSDAQAHAALAVRKDLAEASKSTDSSTSVVHAAIEAQRSGSELGRLAVVEPWTKLEAAHVPLVASLEKAAVEASAAAGKAVASGGGAARAAVERAEAAQAKSRGTLQTHASSHAAALSAHVVQLRETLASNPLAAFSNSENFELGPGATAAKLLCSGSMQSDQRAPFREIQASMTVA